MGAFIVRRNTDQDGATVLDWTRSAAIQSGTATNRLGVRAQGADVTLLINGQEVGRARAEELGPGGVGFGVGSLGDGPAAPESAARPRLPGRRVSGSVCGALLVGLG